MDRTDDRQRRQRSAQSRQAERYDRQPRRQPPQYERQERRRRDEYEDWEYYARRTAQSDRRRSDRQPDRYGRPGNDSRERTARRSAPENQRCDPRQTARYDRQGERYDRGTPARRTARPQDAYLNGARRSGYRQPGYDASRRRRGEDPRREPMSPERRRAELERRRRRERARRRRRRQQRNVLLLLLLVIGVMIAVVCNQGGKDPEGTETQVPIETWTQTPTEAPTKPPLEVTVISGVEDLATLEVPDYVDVKIIDVDGSSRRGVALTDINDIVIHYVGNPGTTAWQNWDWYTESNSTVSSHFVVGLEGEVIQCIPLNEKSSASNHRNTDTISIEVCHPDSTGKFNQATYDTLVELTAWLAKSCGLEVDNVIRHYDVTGKVCPQYFVENEDAWVQFKADVAARMG